jgi:hypothetical protein
VSDKSVSSDTIRTWIHSVEVVPTEETKGTGGNETIVIVEMKGIISMVGEMILVGLEMIPSVAEMILVVE